MAKHKEEMKKEKMPEKKDMKMHGKEALKEKMGHKDKKK